MDDVLIVGAGVIGLSLAYELARGGVRVRLLDRAAPGQEASWAGAGILPPGSRATAVEPYEQLAGLSHELHAQWAEQLTAESGIDTGYRRTGGLHLFANTDAETVLDASLAHELANWRRRGIAVEEIPGDRLREVEPALAESNRRPAIAGALYLPGECQLRNPWHLRALAAAGAARGVTIEPNTAVEEFVVDRRRIHAVRTARGLLSAGAYCICGGAWSGELLARLGVRLAVKPIRGQMALLACRMSPPGASPSIHAAPPRHILMDGIRYLVPRTDGRVLVGSTEEDVGFEKRPTADGIDGLLRFALELAPGLRSATFERGWAGLRPGTADRLPYLGPIPGLENGFLAAGHFRSGLQWSPATAVVMAQQIRGQTPEIDLRPFALDRPAPPLS